VAKNLTNIHVASSPGPSQILSRSRGERDFSPRLRDKIWEGPGDEANIHVQSSFSVRSTGNRRAWILRLW